MLLFFIALLGVGNFALHKAVLESGHPLLGQVPWFVHLLGGKIGLGVEFLLLLAALLLVSQDSSGAGLAYLVYTLTNVVSAWLILTHRI